MTRKARGDSQRMTTRRQAAWERENRILELTVEGFNDVEIAQRMELTSQAVGVIRRRGLERRAIEMAPVVEQARALYLMQLQSLISAYWPWATGTSGTIDDDGLPIRPDVRSAELLLKVIDRYAAAGGALQSTPIVESTTTNNILVVGSDQDSQSHREQIMRQLAAAASKHDVVEGELAKANVTLGALTGTADLDDRPGLPPGEDED